MNKDFALKKLSELIDQGKVILEGREYARLEKWKLSINIAVDNLYGKGSPKRSQLNQVRYSLGFVSSNTPAKAHENARRNGIKKTVEILESYVEEINDFGWSVLPDRAADVMERANAPYISQERIDALKALNDANFDFLRLIKICEEINSAYINSNFITVGALARVLIDHIPPVFGYSTFKEVASNYPARSNKEIFLHLEQGTRKIADSLIHQTIRKKEILPTVQQVSFIAHIDVLLGEIIRTTQEKNA